MIGLCMCVCVCWSCLVSIQTSARITCGNWADSLGGADTQPTVR